VEQPLALGAVKRGFVVLVERAQADVIGSALLQFHPVGCHHGHEVGRAFDGVEVRVHSSKKASRLNWLAEGFLSLHETDKAKLKLKANR
jgi:hypothetical protein